MNIWPDSDDGSSGSLREGGASWKDQRFSISVRPMKHFLLVVALGVFGGSSALAKTASFQLGVGQRRDFPISNAVGVVISNPEIADIALLSNNRVQVFGSAAGSAQLEVWTPAGKVVKHTIVVEAQGDVREATPPVSRYVDDVWDRAKYGGQKVPTSVCGLDVLSAEAKKELREARWLLQYENPLPALERLERLIASTPDAAVARIFLGAAHQRSNNEARGIAEYETYVLSCPDDVLAPPLIGVLRDFSDRNAPSKPSNEVEMRSKRRIQRGKLAHQSAASKRMARHARVMRALNVYALK